MTTEEKKDRGAALLATRKAKLDEYFRGKRFEIVREVHLEGSKRFQTPFGNKGKHGYVLRELGNPAAEEVLVGATMLQRLADDYQAVTVPPKERKRRTKEEKAAADAAKAQERADKAAAKAANN